MQKKKLNVHLTVSVYYSHANALKCKNIYLKKQDTSDCILENMIKS